MTKFACINPDKREIFIFEASNYKEALERVGLEQGKIDFGNVGHTHSGSFSIMVYEFGLINPKQKTYFRLGKQLFNGSAVIFKANLEGETVDFPEQIVDHWKSGCPEFEFFKDISSVEKAISSNRVIRPQTRINNEIVWEWNRPKTIH